MGLARTGLCYYWLFFFFLFVLFPRSMTVIVSPGIQENVLILLLTSFEALDTKSCFWVFPFVQWPWGRGWGVGGGSNCSDEHKITSNSKLKYLNLMITWGTSFWDSHTPSSPNSHDDDLITKGIPSISSCSRKWLVTENPPPLPLLIGPQTAFLPLGS